MVKRARREGVAMGKIKLPKAVCNALDYAIKKGITAPEIVSKTFRNEWEYDLYLELKKISAQVVMYALVYGYEPERTPEEEMKYLFEFYNSQNEFDRAFRQGIKTALFTHGLLYDWMNGDAE